MADEGGPYEDGDSPPARHREYGSYDGHVDRENGDRRREVLLFCTVCFFDAKLLCV